MLLKNSLSPMPSDKTTNLQQEVPQPNCDEDAIVTITLPVIKEHKITIQGVPDLNGDGTIDFKDVILLIKQILEMEDLN